MCWWNLQSLINRDQWIEKRLHRWYLPDKVFNHSHGFYQLTYILDWAELWMLSAVCYQLIVLNFWFYTVIWSAAVNIVFSRALSSSSSNKKSWVISPKEHKRHFCKPSSFLNHQTCPVTHSQTIKNEQRFSNTQSLRILLKQESLLVQRQSS